MTFIKNLFWLILFVGAFWYTYSYAQNKGYNQGMDHMEQMLAHVGCGYGGGKGGTW